MSLTPERKRELLIEAAMAMAARRMQHPHDAKQAESSFVATATDYASDAAGVLSWASDGLKAIAGAVGVQFLPSTVGGWYTAHPNENRYAKEMRENVPKVVSAVRQAFEDARKVPQYDASIRRFTDQVRIAKGDEARARAQLEAVSKERDDLQNQRQNTIELTKEIDAQILALTSENLALTAERDDLVARLNRLHHKQSRQQLSEEIARLKITLAERDARAAQLQRQIEVQLADTARSEADYLEARSQRLAAPARDDAKDRLARVEELLGKALATAAGADAKVSVSRPRPAPALATATAMAQMYPGWPPCAGWPCGSAKCKEAGKCQRP